jgi:hypothetical protein
VSHAKLCSPSKADGWFACAGRSVMESAFPDKGNEYSADGSARHEIVALCLKSTDNCIQHVGRMIDVDGTAIRYDEDWVAEDQDYVDTVRGLTGSDGELFVEREVNFERFTDVQGDSFGTADAIVFKPLADSRYELIVVDRKTGWHEVAVEGNKQLQLYALGAYDEFSMVYDIARVRLVIHQRAAREWDCSIEELLKFGEEARSRAISVVNAVQMHGKVDQAEWERTFLNAKPNETDCAYCRAMSTCPSMQRTVQSTVGADFEEVAAINPGALHEIYPIAELSTCMTAVAVIEDWCKAVRAEVERKLLAGENVPGFKLVLGKAGARAWKDPDTVEASLKAMRLKVEEMYDLKLISPTSAEKLAKAKVLGPRQWTKLQPLIGRSDPKPSVAPLSDKRDAYVPPDAANDFQPEAEASDLA